MKTKARYYKCPLQVNSCRYAKHIRDAIEDEVTQTSQLLKRVVLL